MHAKTGSAIAGEALEHIGALYAVEREIAGQPPDELCIGVEKGPG